MGEFFKKYASLDLNMSTASKRTMPAEETDRPTSTTVNPRPPIVLKFRDLLL